MIQKLFETIAIGPLGAIGEATEKTLEFTKNTISKSLNWSGDSLEVLSKNLAFWEEARLKLEETSKNLKLSSEEHRIKIESAIQDSVSLFEKGLKQVKFWEKTTDTLITENRVLSSILGSTMDGSVKLSKITMSFRNKGEDITTKQLVDDFLQSGDSEITFFIPGLFTDESLWRNKRVKIKERMVLSRGLGDFLDGRGYYPAYIRFNHGLHISENGTELLKLVHEINELLPDVKIHIVAYSIGCLITRSMLYQSKQDGEKRICNLGKVVHIASPDKGSYLEKLGFWVGILMEKAPVTAVSIIGKIGNFRSDAIKDLSHGIIRREDWAIQSPAERSGKDFYFGELDGEDFYQAYAVFSLPDKPALSWMGDGIVEVESLRYLSTKLTHQLPNPTYRIQEIQGANHFTILNSGLLFRWIDQIFPRLRNL